MQKDTKQTGGQELGSLVIEAVESLAKLDVCRLEELALSCRALNDDRSPERKNVLLHDRRVASRDMALLAKVLEATRSNAAVMDRLRQMHDSRIEYSAGQSSSMGMAEAVDGHN